METRLSQIRWLFCCKTVPKNKRKRRWHQFSKRNSSAQAFQRVLTTQPPASWILMHYCSSRHYWRWERLMAALRNRRRLFNKGALRCKGRVFQWWKNLSSQASRIISQAEKQSHSIQVVCDQAFARIRFVSRVWHCACRCEDGQYSGRLWRSWNSITQVYWFWVGFQLLRYWLSFTQYSWIHRSWNPEVLVNAFLVQDGRVSGFYHWSMQSLEFWYVVYGGLAAWDCDWISIMA